MADPTVTYAGWVYKEGSLIKNWKRRFLVVKRSDLSYYKSSNPRNAALMGSMRIARVEHAAAITNGLIIHSMEGRALRLYMDTEAQRDKCFNAIAEWCHAKPETSATLTRASTAESTYSAMDRQSSGSATTSEPEERFSSSGRAQKVGWLSKQGKNMPTWKRRYFELQEGILTYAKHAGRPVLARHRVFGVREDPSKPFTLVLTLDTGRELRVTGQSDEDIHDWHAALRATFENNGAAERASDVYGRPSGIRPRESFGTTSTPHRYSTGDPHALSRGHVRPVEHTRSHGAPVAARQVVEAPEDEEEEIYEI